MVFKFFYSHTNPEEHVSIFRVITVRKDNIHNKTNHNQTMWTFYGSFCISFYISQAPNMHKFNEVSTSDLLETVIFGAIFGVIVGAIAKSFSKQDRQVCRNLSRTCCRMTTYWRISLPSYLYFIFISRIVDWSILCIHLLIPPYKAMVCTVCLFIFLWPGPPFTNMV